MAHKEKTAADQMPSMKALCAATGRHDRLDQILKRFRAVVDGELQTLEQSGCIADAEDTADVLEAILENRLKHSSTQPYADRGKMPVH